MSVKGKVLARHPLAAGRIEGADRRPGRPRLHRPVERLPRSARPRQREPASAKASPSATTSTGFASAPCNAKSPGSEVAVDTKTFKPIVWRSYNGVQADRPTHPARRDDRPGVGRLHPPRPRPGQQLGSVRRQRQQHRAASSVRTQAEHDRARSGWLTAGAAAAGHKLAAVVPQDRDHDETADDPRHRTRLRQPPKRPREPERDHRRRAPPTRRPRTCGRTSPPAPSRSSKDRGSSGERHQYLDWTGYLVTDHRLRHDHQPTRRASGPRHRPLTPPSQVTEPGLVPPSAGGSPHGTRRPRDSCNQFGNPPIRSPMCWARAVLVQRLLVGR